MTKLSAVVVIVVVVVQRVLLADNNAQPNPSHFKMRYLEFSWTERGGAWWTGPGSRLSNYTDKLINAHCTPCFVFPFDNVNYQTNKSAILQQ